MTQPLAHSRSDVAAPIRLGLAGLGMAGGVMALAADSHPGFVVAGAADPDENLRRRFEADREAVTHADVRDLVRRDDIDAVYIGTPHQMHGDHVELAAAHGKHIIVEKPMSLSLDDCDRMIAAAQAANVQLIVGHTHSFDPAIQRMRDIIASGEIGAARMICAINYTDFLYRPRRPEELDTALGGGIIFNQIPHQVDMIRALLPGPVRAVRAVTGALDEQRPTEGICSAIIEFASGAFASLTYSGQDGFDSDELHGWISEGGGDKRPAHGSARRALRALNSPDQEAQERVTRFGYGSGLSARAPQHQPHFGLFIVTCERGEMRPSAAGVTVFDEAGAREVTLEQHPWRPGRGDVLETLRRALHDDETPLQNGAFGRDTLKICLAILRSAREHREIRLDDAHVQ